MWQRATRTDGAMTYSTNRRFGRSVFLLLAVFSLLPIVLAACAGNSQTNAKLAKDQTFVWPYEDSTTGTPKISDATLDPAVIASIYDANIAQMIYTNLVTFDSSLHVIPDAASSWTISGKGTIYTFHLRPNLKFSDGTPITASDFAYSIDRALSQSLCTVDDAKSYGPQGLNRCYSLSGTYLGAIRGAQGRLNGGPSLVGQGNDASHSVDAVDPQTLQIQISSPIAYFLDALAYSTSDPVEKSVVTNSKWSGGQWVNHLDQGGCSGPFQVKSYGNGTQLTFVPNPYWEQAFGKQLTVTSVERPFVTPDQEYQNYRAGTFGYDYATVPANLYSQAYGQSDFHEIPELATDYFGINTAMAPFSDKDANGNPNPTGVIIRRAFDLALNRQLLVDRIENGGAVPTIHIVPQGMPGFDAQLLNPPPDNTEAITGNQDAAVALIKQAQAQCPAQPPFGTTLPAFCPYITGSHPQAIDFYVQNDSTSTQLGDAAAAQWHSVLGVNINVMPSSFDDIVSHYQVGQQVMPMFQLGWIADYPDPQDWLTNLFKSSATYNASNLNDSKLDALLAKADDNPNQTQRLAQYAQAEQMVVNDVAWLPYDQPRLAWRMPLQVRGFGFNAFGLVQDVSWPNVQLMAS